jgi:hypothetical protein
MMRSRLTRLLALVALAAPALAQTAPELPRAVPSAAALPVSAVRSVPAGGDLQAALAGAKSGDAIELPCTGVRYSGHFTSAVSGVTIRGACWASLPAGRMTPAIAAQFKLPTLVTPDNAPAFSTAPGVHHVALIGLEITTSSSVTNALIALGSDQQRTLAEIPHDLVLDRLYVHGTPTGTLRRCIALNSGATAVVRSWCADAHENGSDSQFILSWTGTGPYLIADNYGEAGHEVIMFGGGGDPLIPGVVASDITITHNTITRPAAWQGVWQVKALLELKSARRVRIEGNELSNNWASAQDGTAVLIKSVNQGGTCTWCGTTDVTIRWNWIHHVGGGFNLAAAPEGPNVVPLARVSITDNLVTGINAPGFNGVGTAFMVQMDIADVEIARNTVVAEAPAGTVVFKGLEHGLQRFRYTYNLSAAPMTYGMYGDNTGQGFPTLNTYAPGGVVTGNLFAGANQFDTKFYAPGYPAGNRFVAQTADLSFAADYSRAGQDSAGVDVAKLRAALAGAVTPPIPPVPAPVPTISLPQLRAAIAAIDRVVSASGRENAATKAALAPVAVYLHALLATTP